MVRQSGAEHATDNGPRQTASIGRVPWADTRVTCAWRSTGQSWIWKSGCTSMQRRKCHKFIFSAVIWVAIAEKRRCAALCSQSNRASNSISLESPRIIAID